MRFRRLKRAAVQSVEELGPGLVTGAADDDPSGIATYSQAGAQFGYGLMWTMVLCYPLMSAVQLVSAHIGRVTGRGLASNLVSTFPKQFVGLLIGILLIANIINIGADLSAMADAAELVTGGGEHVFVIIFAIVSTVLQLFVPYRGYASILKWLTLSLFAYVAVLLVVRIDWPAALRGLVWPSNL
jgi:Mn2+/Fe2+ NRAMP family transporter